jgi:hypothetical protein
MPGKLCKGGQRGVGTGRHQQGVTVGIGAHQLVDRDDAAGAGLALHQDRLADALAELLPDNARDDVDAAARCERHQQADRMAWEFGLRRRAGRECKDECGDDRHPNGFCCLHWFLPPGGYGFLPEMETF